MLLAQMLAGSLALTAGYQVQDAVSRSQNAFTACLRQFVDSSVQGRKAVDAFNTELPQQCATQEAAYRQAMIRRDTSSRMRAAEAEEMATEEITYARDQAKETFADAQPR